MQDETSPLKPMRLAKRIAEAGICSRRKAEVLITDGRVQVNGKTILTPACTVTYHDEVTVNGETLPQQQARIRVWLFHKPAGCITTTNDPQERKTVFDYIPKDLPRVITIGRLDYNSEGLLLLTNNGDAARYCELPKTAWKRSYRVRAHGSLNKAAIIAAEKGLTIKGIRYEPIIIKQEILDEKETKKTKSKRSNSWYEVTLTEGKNREIRKVFEHFGLVVNRLIRTSYGPFNLGTLPKGSVRELPVNVVKKHLGHLQKGTS